MDELFSLDSGPPAHAQVYTDGGCDPNPGPGGWAAIVHLGKREWVLQGNDLDTTNNRMELQAATAALALLEKMMGRCQVDLYTDSQYLRQGITEWIDGWMRNGWRTHDKEPVKNQDLWRALHQFTQAHDIEWHWLEGHAGHPFNERADWLASQARRSLDTPRRQSMQAQCAPAPDNLTAVEMCVKAAGRGGAQPGVWAAVLRLGDHTRDLSGGDPAATTNALLIRAATQGLQALTRPCRVTIYSDAEYLIKGASQWVKGWQARGWQTKEGKPVANRADWEVLLEAASQHHITWQIVTEETAPADMERAAQMAVDALEELASGGIEQV